jgi:hypothetical protein
MKIGRCIFCGEEQSLTAEHPMSKRVLDLAGFGLDDVSLVVDIAIDELTVDDVACRMKSVREQFVTCVCAPCNNGWMQALDHSFAGTIQRWMESKSDRLGHTGFEVVARYLMKVLWIHALGEPWTGDLIVDGEFTSPVILNPRFGISTKRGDVADYADVIDLGVARIPQDSIFTHAVFTPRLIGHAPRSGLRRFSAGVVVGLPKLGLQLWLVHRMTASMSTSWPTGVESLSSKMRSRDLHLAPSKPRIDDVVLTMHEAT